MILRKPYAFLIKHFKLIHLIMVALILLLIYQTNILLNFFNDFISSSQIIIGSNAADSLFSNYMYLAAVGVIIIATIVLILMSFKNKPKLYYVLTIIGYILLIVLFSYSMSTIVTMQKQAVDTRIVRAIRDFLNIMFVFEIYTLAISFIRSIGLDVKKFDFKDDVDDLDLNDLDNEEFEVNVEFDAASLKRKIRGEYRNLKYYFIENKLMLLAIIAILLLSGSFFLYRALKDDTREYQMNQAFSPIGYNMIVENGYVTSQDQKLAKIFKEDKALVVIKFKIKTLNKTEKFVFGKLALKIGDTKYYHDNSYADRVSDLGVSYISQALTDVYQDYILIYEIPSELRSENMELIYTEQLVSGIFKAKTDDIRVPLNIVDLDVNKDVENIGVGQNYIIGDGLLNGYEMKLNSYGLDNNFKINYSVCINSLECYTYYEYLAASLSGISDKAVLKLNMDLSIPDQGSIKNVGNLITSFGYMEYLIDGKTYTQKITKKLDSTHNDGNYYFEIKKEVLNAEEVSLLIKVRNCSYKFRLK